MQGMSIGKAAVPKDQAAKKEKSKMIIRNMFEKQIDRPINGVINKRFCTNSCKVKGFAGRRADEQQS